MPEYNVRSTVFLKHRTNGDSVCMQCSQELYMEHNFDANSTDPLVVFDRVIGEVIGRLVSTTVLRRRSGV